MAYELSSSLGSGGMNRIHITTSNAGSNQDQMYGGKFSPDGTKLAVPMTQRQGTTGNDVVPGIDIYHSSSAGWTIQESIDTWGRNPSSGYTMQQIEWYNDHEIWGLHGPNLSGSQIFRWVSDSSGWTSGYGFNQNRAIVPGVSSCRGFNFSPDKKAVVVFNSSNSSNDDRISVVVSGSSPWTTQDVFDTNLSDQMDNAILGGLDENGKYKLFVANSIQNRIYSRQVDPVTAEIITPSDSSKHSVNNRSGQLMYWHEESKTLLVNYQASNAQGGSYPTGYLFLYQSQSDGSAFLNSANSVDALGGQQVLLNVDPSLGARYASGSEDRIIFGAPYVYTTSFRQGNIQALESGSSGWKHSIIDGQMSAQYAGNIDVSTKGAIVGNPGLYEVEEGNGNVPGFFNNSFGNSTGNRKDHAGIFTIRQFDALDNSDATGPSVSSVAITSATNAQNSTLNEGDVVSVTVTMDEATVVNTTGGTPFITLNVGGVSRNASYASGTGTTSLIFQYTIASSETTDSDGISIGANAISLNSGTMQDAAGNDATITHSAVSANSSFKVDTTKPTISSLSVAANNSTVTVTFAEDVYASSNGTGDLVAADFTLGLSGGNQANISLNATPSGISKTAQNIWVLTLNGTDLDSIALGTETLSVDAADNTSIFDLAGNAHTAAASTVSLNDTATIADSVSSSIGSSGGTVKAGNTTVAPEVEITVPTDALSANVTIGANVEESFDPKVAGVTQAGGKVGLPHSNIIRLTPHGTTFEQAVTVKFRLVGSVAGTCPTDLQIWKRNSATGIWYQINRDTWSCSSGVITLSTTSFSDYAAIGGKNMARTKINNVQLARLTEADKVLPEAINITGSSEAVVTSVNDSDAFIIQQANSVAKHISGSALKTYFAGGGLNVTGSNSNDAHRITFVDPSDDHQIGLAVDGTGSFTYVPSTNTMTVGTVSATNVDGILGANAAAVATVTTITVNTSILPDAAGGADIGSTGAEFGDVYIADDKKIYFGNDQDASIEYDEDGTDTLSIAGADVLIADDKKLFFGAGKDASFEYDEDGTDKLLYAGASLRISDDVKLEFGTGGDASFEYDEDGTDTLLYDGASLRINDDTKLEFGAGGDASFEYDEDGTDTLLYTGASMRFTDDVKLEFGTGGDASIEYDENGTDQLRITGNSIFANNVEIDGTINADSTSDFADTMVLSKGSGNALEVSNGGAAVFNGDVDLGNATSDTITATGRFDSDLVPSSNNARDLGASGNQWKDLYIDGAAHIDALGQDLDAGGFDITNVENLTASAIQVQQLDVVTINSITQSETTLEIDDKLIVSAVSASSANADGGGLRIGGGEDLQGHASVLWNHASSSLDLTIGDEAQLTLKDGSLLPSRNNDVDLGSTAVQFKDLHLTGTANIDSLVLADGVAVASILDEDDFTSDSATALATQQSIKAYVQANGGSFFLEDDDGTEVNIVNSSEIKFIGSGITTNFTNTSNGTDADPFDLTFTIDAAQTGITSVLNASLVIGRDADNDIDFATDNEITFRAGGEDQLKLVDGALTPSSNAIVDLGTDALEFKDLYIDGTAYLDAVDIDGGNIDGAAIGANDPSTIVATTITANTSILPDAAGGADIGSTGAEFGDVYIADDKKIYFGNDQDASIEYDEDGTDTLSIAGADVLIADDKKLYFGAGKDASFEYDEDGTDKLLYAGASLRISDDTKLEFGTGGDASFEYDEDGNDVLLYAGAALRISDDVKIEFGSGGDAGIEYDEDGTDQLRIHQPAAGVVIAGTNPKLVIGDAGEEDTMLVFDGNAQDFRVGLDDGTDTLELGVGATHGTTTSLKLDSSLNVDVAGHNGMSVGLQLGGTLVSATAAELNIMDGNTSAVSTTPVAADRVVFNDAGTMKQVAMSDLGAYFGGGAGLQVTDGALSIVTVQDVFTSQSKGSGVGTLSADLVTASLSQDAVTGSIQVYLNGMLQTPSGSVESEGTALFDYILATGSFTEKDGGTYTHRDGPPRVIFAAAIDSDDVVQLRYLKL